MSHSSISRSADLSPLISAKSDPGEPPLHPASSRPLIHLLIVEDDQALCSELAGYFLDQGYAVTTAPDGPAALHLLRNSPCYDLVILNLVLPRLDGFAVLKEIKPERMNTGFLVLSIRGALEDRLRCFKLGADDYLEKPFHLKELEARVEAILRRIVQPQSPPSSTYAVQDLSVDFSARTCYRKGERISLTAVEFDILQYLIKHRGRTVSREDLAQGVWDTNCDISLRTIDRHVATIRQKLNDDPSAPMYLQTVYGRGYRFMPAE